LPAGDPNADRLQGWCPDCNPWLGASRGIVAEKTAEVGQHVQASEQLLAISQLEDIWITANFRETQLKQMRAGQPADIHVDAYNVTFHG
jgi:membrane fusion protein (multidrug efflux system)